MKKQNPDILQLKESLCNALPLIQSLQQKRDSHVLVFISEQPISQYVSYKMSQVLRRVGPVENLDVVLESGGGSLDSAYKVLKMLKSYAKKVTVIVPFYAKSAASLIAIGANELMMCKSGELGPIDPQVHDPQSGRFIPAHSIKEAIAFIEETKDNTVKLSLADKIPVLLIGAYREAGTSSKQYLKDVLTEQYDCVKDKITETFTERFLSHGYPMDRDFLEKTGIKVTHPSEEIESLLCDLHEEFTDMIFRLYENNHDPEKEILVIQTEKVSSISLGSTDVTSMMNIPDATDNPEDDRIKTKNNVSDTD